MSVGVAHYEIEDSSHLDETTTAPHKVPHTVHVTNCCVIHSRARERQENMRLPLKKPQRYHPSFAWSVSFPFWLKSSSCSEVALSKRRSSEVFSPLMAKRGAARSVQPGRRRQLPASGWTSPLKSWESNWQRCRRGNRRGAWKEVSSVPRTGSLTAFPFACWWGKITWPVSRWAETAPLSGSVCPSAWQVWKAWCADALSGQSCFSSSSFLLESKSRSPHVEFCISLDL